jgi:hypothetical protein
MTQFNMTGDTKQVIINYRTPNAERRTSNAERRTPNAERRTPNIERRTSNIEHQTSNIKHPIRPFSSRVLNLAWPLLIGWLLWQPQRFSLWHFFGSSSDNACKLLAVRQQAIMNILLSAKFSEIPETEIGG